MQIPRNEHPNPQFMRENWLSLNGEWQFEIDNSSSGRARKLFSDDYALNSKIIVPFCPESKLSGIENKDFMNCVWYKRTVEITEEQLENDVIIHFDAVDYEAEVYINGVSAGTHKGGYVGFKLDITSLLKAGTNTITLCAEDNIRCPLVPRGKQSEEYFSHHCDYTRTTGIWQSVWLEFVPKTHIESFKIFPNVRDCAVGIQLNLKGKAALKATAYYDGKVVGEASVDSCCVSEKLRINLSEKHLWEIGCGRLYDIEITYGDDCVKTYFGLREVKLDGYKFLLNDKSIFQRLILDQGFYPDGIYTAPTDEELLGDIRRSVAYGFNGARLHQKVFEPRFLYHADKEGYIVWGEYPNWGADHTRPDSVYPILFEWLEEIERDFNHPSIIGWCPFNETWDMHGCQQYDDALRAVYRATKAADGTRPCIDTSGNFHVETDIFDVHDYDQNPETFAERYVKLGEGTIVDRFEKRQQYKPGQPFFISEYGGIGWNVVDGWGYGNAPKSEEEFYQRYKGLADAMLDNEYILGLCYTQLTDIEQEQNGLYTYDRKPKFDVKKYHDVLARKAAIED